ncbi:MAG: MFS transporter [Bacteroidetes bacterium]|nr:MFS transporter [Bacteroidota bacterium]
MLNSGITQLTSRVRKNFKSLRHYNYRLYWISQLISVTGTWMQNVALAWLVVTLTDSAVALGTVTALQFLPILIFSLFAGVVIDRLPKREIIIWTQSISAVQAFILWILVALKVITLWEIYALSLLIGFVNAFDQPGRQAFVAEMVPDEDVGNAVALNSLLFNAARTIGPAIAGITIAVVGVAPSFLLNGVSYLAIIVALFLMRASQLRTFTSKVDKTLKEGLKEGISYAINEPSIASILIVLIFIGTFGYNFSTMLPLLVKFVLHGGPDVFGVLTSALGIGSMIGALLVAGRQKPTRKFIFAFAALFGIIEVALSLSRNFVLTIILLVSLGIASIAYIASTNTSLQMNSPMHLRGRIMGLYVVIFAGSTPIGALFTGFVAEWLGTVPMIFVEGILCLVGVGLGVVYIKRKVTAIETKEVPETTGTP